LDLDFIECDTNIQTSKVSSAKPSFSSRRIVSLSKGARGQLRSAMLHRIDTAPFIFDLQNTILIHLKFIDFIEI
jgi:hypothetical protein